MRLEDEIKQEKFENENHKLIVNIQFTANWLSTIHNRVLKPFGISSQQFNVLRILKGQFPNPSSLNLIKERMLDKESNASRLIDKLVGAKLVNRITCPNNRRQVDITITKAGIKLLEDINIQIKKLNSAMPSLNEDDAKTLNALLDKLREK